MDTAAAGAIVEHHSSSRVLQALTVEKAYPRAAWERFRALIDVSTVAEGADGDAGVCRGGDNSETFMSALKVSCSLAVRWLFAGARGRDSPFSSVNGPCTR